MARVEDLEIGAVSIVGPGHRCEEPATPRQDAYRLSRDAACRHLVVAIADGMSDSDQSHLGAAVAAGALATALRTELDRGTELAALDAPRLFLDAARQMAGLAAQRNLREDAVRAAALAAVIQVEAGVDGLRRVWIASVGDASAWRRLPDGWERLIGWDKAGYDESALSEFLPFHPDRAVSRAIGLQRGAVLALTTDGIGDVLQAGGGGAAWFAERWERPRHIADMLLDVGYEAKSHIDDRTAVVVWSDVGADP